MIHDKLHIPLIFVEKFGHAEPDFSTEYVGIHMGYKEASEHAYFFIYKYRYRYLVVTGADDGGTEVLLYTVLL